MDPHTPLIQRYPYDLLRSIFQEVVESAPHLRHRLSVSIGLSSVCRNWWHVAVRCPMLWRYITFYMKKIDSISGMAKVLASRASMTPVTICVDYTGAYNNAGIPPRGALNHCLIHSFSGLHTLKFRFDTSMEQECIDKYYSSGHDGTFDLTDILDDVHHLPKNPIQELYILHRDPKSKSGLALSFTGADEFVSKLTPSRSLHLSIRRLMLPDVPRSWSALQELSVFSQAIEPDILFGVPNLVNLELGHIILYNCFEFPLVIQLPNLQDLNLDWCPHYRGLTRVLCPNLQKLTITSLYPGSWRLFYLSSELAHLTTLTLNVDVDAFCDIAPFLPQIKVLSATVFNFRYEILEVLSDWWGWCFVDPPFPCLQDLSFHIMQIDGEEGGLSLDTFNKFVRNRLLPLGHPKRPAYAANNPIQRFNVSGDIEAISEWLKSKYIGLFDVEKSESGEPRQVTLKWPAAR